jgi:hypothetical protein
MNAIVEHIDKINKDLDTIACLEYFKFKSVSKNELFSLFHFQNNEYLVFKNNDDEFKIVDLSNLEYIKLFETLLVNDLLNLNELLLDALLDTFDKDIDNKTAYKRTSLRVCIAILTDYKEALDDSLGLFRRNDTKYPYAIKLQGRSTSKAMKDCIIFNENESHSLFKNGSSIMNNIDDNDDTIHLMFNPYFILEREKYDIKSFVVLNKHSRSYDYNRSALDLFSNKRNFKLLINRTDPNIWFNSIYLFNYFINQILNKIFVFSTQSECKRFIYFNYSWKTSGDINKNVRKDITINLQNKDIASSMININGLIKKRTSSLLFPETQSEIYASLGFIYSRYSLGTFVNSRNKEKDTITHKISNNYISVYSYIEQIKSIFDIQNFSLIIK